jgi:hypothetical protein
MSVQKICRIILVALFLSLPMSELLAHDAEPISTEFALPFLAGAGNQKIEYDYEPGTSGGSVHALPLELEFGGGPRWQLDLGFEFVRSKNDPDQPATVAGGRVEIGTRYLLFGGDDQRYAVSLQGTIEPPTGNRRLFGDAPTLSPAMLLDRSLGNRFQLHANWSWTTTVGETDDPERVFEYRSGVVWLASRHWFPVIEFLGATSTGPGTTQVSIQPEAIFRPNSRVELKVGVPLGTTVASPRVGLRSQVSILWGSDE